MPPSREQRSLFGEILDWMLAPLLLLWPMSVALTWVVAQGIANRPYDRALGDMARALAQQVQIVPGPASALPREQVGGASGTSPGTPSQASARFTLPPSTAQLLRADEIDTIYYQVLGVRGELLSGDQALRVPVDDLRQTPGELRLRDDLVGNEPVRVAYLWVARPGAGTEGLPLVQVAETLDKRSQLATEIIKGVILPQFVILPLAVVLVWFALARGIAPLNHLQQDIRRRAADDLSPINETEAPEEVSPLVHAINDLLSRLDRSFATQKRFLADAAHQLKTPLAGLRTQAELAQREIDLGEREPEALKRSLQQIALSSQRAAHMVNQLLAMARAEHRDAATRAETVDLPALATSAVRELVPLAMDKRIDLGYEGPGADDWRGHATARRRVHGHAILLRELIANLVDNAIRYTPAGGSVTVRVIEDPFGQVLVLQVEDTGPGIAAVERELVLQPFYRVLGTQVDGSGLGLAIVAEIARQHGASIEIDDARKPPLPEHATPGTRFTLRFPCQPASAGGGRRDSPAEANEAQS